MSDASPISLQEFGYQLDELPRSVAVAVGLRIALRVLPLTATGSRFVSAWKWKEATAPLRACLACIEWLANPSPTTLAAALQAGAAGFAAAHAAEFESTGVAVASEAAAEVTELIDPDSKSAVGAGMRVAAAALQMAHTLAPGFARNLQQNIQSDAAQATSSVASNDAHQIVAFDILSRPLWPDEVGILLRPHFSNWTDAIRALARTKQSPDSSDAEAERLVHALDGLLHGAPDWPAILSPDAYRKVRPNLRSQMPSAAPLSLPPADFPLFLARLAYQQPTALALTEAPTREQLTTLLTPAQRADLPAFAAQLTRETGDFAPDPLWLAWVQAAHAPFFAPPAAASRAPFPAPAAAPADAAPATETASPTPSAPETDYDMRLTRDLPVPKTATFKNRVTKERSTSGAAPPAKTATFKRVTEAAPKAPPIKSTPAPTPAPAPRRPQSAPRT